MMGIRDFFKEQYRFGGVGSPYYVLRGKFITRYLASKVASGYRNKGHDVKVIAIRTMAERPVTGKYITKRVPVAIWGVYSRKHKKG